ncbi:MAG: hypothetical protein ACI8PT_004923 [Gammaproteobacteria bacterium]|jgi:hypothetical protein
MSFGEFLWRHGTAEFAHYSLPASERLVRVFTTIVEPRASRLARLVADFFHGRALGAKAVCHNL